MHSKIRRLESLAATILLTGALAVAGCGGDDASTGVSAGLVVPGDAVFPEGVAVDKSNGNLFVGSTADGTVFRAKPGAAEFDVFLPAGEDGRDEVTGLKVDPEGRLFVAGRSSGQLFVYDAGTGDLLRTLRAPGEGETLINDITFTAEAAYVTDSYRDVVYRVPLDDGGGGAAGIGEMEPWLDLAGTPIPTGTGFGLNGISASDDGRYLLTVHTDTGELFRIDARTREVEPVDLGGASLPTGDGLLLDAQTLLAVQEEPAGVVPIELSADLLSGQLGESFGSEELDFPTTLAEYDGTIYVVNSQLDGAPDDPEPPFTVAELPAADVLPD